MPLYNGLAVGGPRDGERMVHDHEEIPIHSAEPRPFERDAPPPPAPVLLGAYAWSEGDRGWVWTPA
jgi:hypothetical protein